MASALRTSLQLGIAAIQERLADDQHAIIWCVAGSAALVLHGMPDYAPKDLDVFVGASWKRIMDVFKRVPGFQLVGAPQRNDNKGTSEGLVQFTFTAGHTGSSKSRGTKGKSRAVESVTIDFLCVDMNSIHIGQINGSPVATLFQMFKAKIHAVATRAQPKDVKHLDWILRHPRLSSDVQVAQLRPQLIGHCLQAFPQLEVRFRALGVDVDECRDEAQVERLGEQYKRPHQYLKDMDVVRRMAIANVYGVGNPSSSVPITPVGFPSRAALLSKDTKPMTLNFRRHKSSSAPDDKDKQLQKFAEIVIRYAEANIDPKLISQYMAKVKQQKPEAYPYIQHIQEQRQARKSDVVRGLSDRMEAIHLVSGSHDTTQRHVPASRAVTPGRVDQLRKPSDEQITWATEVRRSHREAVDSKIKTLTLGLRSDAVPWKEVLFEAAWMVYQEVERNKKKNDNDDEDGESDEVDEDDEDDED